MRLTSKRNGRLRAAAERWDTNQGHVPTQSVPGATTDQPLPPATTSACLTGLTIFKMDVFFY
jgi:hypothetical protein